MDELINKLESDLAQTEKDSRAIWERLNEDAQFLEWRRLNTRENDLRSAINGLKSVEKVSA